MINFIRYTFFILFLINLFSSFSFAEQPKKAYGIPGANLKYYKVTDKKYTYTVKGNDYNVKSVKASKNYIKVGKASYYHKKFHGRRTASGEIFDNNTYTAAHKTLPLNTFVLVTNLNNNRKVIVRINDRGPFSKSRIIDLSKLAAKKLGMLHSGVTKVRLETLYVQKNGKISGTGTNSLSKLAKTKNIKKNLIINENINQKKAPLGNEKSYNDSIYQLKLIGLSSENQAKKISNNLSGKYEHIYIVKNGKNYDIYFRNIDTKSKIKQIKTDIRKFVASPQFIVYEYNK